MTRPLLHYIQTGVSASRATVTRNLTVRVCVVLVVMCTYTLMLCIESGSESLAVRDQLADEAAVSWPAPSCQTHCENLTSASDSLQEVTDSDLLAESVRVFYCCVCECEWVCVCSPFLSPPTLCWVQPGYFGSIFFFLFPPPRCSTQQPTAGSLLLSCTAGHRAAGGRHLARNVDSVRF